MCSAKDIFSKLHEKYTINPADFVAFDVCSSTHDVFKTFVATILSQNSTDKATYIAYKNLESKLGVSVDNILSVTEDKIRELIRLVGLSNSKARYIKNIANFFKNNKIEDLATLSCEELKEKFMSVEGIGEKTADVVLVNCYKCKNFPVDTHIKRVITRLGILGPNPKYKDISNFFINQLNENELLEAHQLLILHGRKTCRAKKPLCESCLLNYCCEYFKNRVGERK